MIWLAVLAAYLGIGVVVILVGERWSQQFDGHDDERMTVLGAVILAVCWPIFVAVVTIDWLRNRRAP